MIRLYIADTDAVFIAKVRHLFRDSQHISVVGSSESGKRAFSEIIALKPDVLLTDIQLPEMDGNALLMETRRLVHAPAVIICTRFYSAASMEMTFKFGAAYYLCKPIDFEHLSETIEGCIQSRIATPPLSGEVASASQSGAARIQQLLSEMGIPSHIHGRAFLAEAIRSLRGNRLLLRNMSCGLYAELADKLNSTPSRVERNLRSAIAISYEHGGMRQVFSRRPTNREFLEYLMDAAFGTDESSAKNK